MIPFRLTRRQASRLLALSALLKTAQPAEATRYGGTVRYIVTANIRR